MRNTLAAVMAVCLIAMFAASAQAQDVRIVRTGVRDNVVIVNDSAPRLGAIVGVADDCGGSVGVVRVGAVRRDNVVIVGAERRRNDNIVVVGARQRRDDVVVVGAGRVRENRTVVRTSRGLFGSTRTEVRTR